MLSRSRLNLLLVLIVIVLAIVVIYKPGKEKPTNTRLSEVDKATITHIQLSRTGQKTIRFEKHGKDWFMTEPYALKANTINVEALLDLLAYNHHGQYDINKLDLATYGLDKPRASIVFNNNLKFEFGGTESLNRYRYILFNHTLNLTDDYYYHRLLGTPVSFLDHALLPTRAKITSLSIPGLTLTQDKGHWTITPAVDKFSNDRANELVDNWQHAHGNEITEYDHSKHQKQGQVRIGLQDQDSPLVFDILTINNTFYLARPDLNIKYQMATEKRRDLLQLPVPLAALPSDKPPASPVAKQP